ncbi:MAG TPA: YceI family protein [Actinomycetota bacterium]|nr:YceI family protein [Actinomycetota bacterium]
MAETSVRNGDVRDIDGVEAPAQGTWLLDEGHTTATFVARHMMVTKVRGHFERVSGQVHIGVTPEDSSVDVTIDAASILSGSTQRDDHLRSPDFLDVDTYPTITFRSTAVKQTGPRSLVVTGDLTIRDQTHPVELNVDFEGVERAPWGATVAGFSARAEIDREQWGMTWNAALETGGVLVGKKVQIEIEVELNPAQAKAA